MGIKRAGFMSAACVIIMTCSLLILGIFLLATANLREALRFAHEKVEIVVFLEDDISRATADSLMAEVESIPFIESIRDVDPATAMERLKREFGNRSYILESLESNPLPASLEITLKPQYRLKQRVEGVAEHLAQLRGVEDVSYGRGWITVLEKVVRVFAVVDIVIGLVVGIAALVTVSYTVRLTLYARRELIKVLKLVGATDFFVMAPFLLEGLLHGIAAILLSIVLLYLGYSAVNTRIPQAVFMPFGMLVFFAAFGLAVAVLGSLVSLRVFLEEKE
ncbi:MAG: permease-like cell division protein FtsX [bacterium]